MGLNVSKGNMYEFVTHTWNTVKGECSHDCSYCYMKRWGKLKPVRFDEKEMSCDLSGSNFIFVGSSNDLFSKDIPEDWIQRTIDHCKKWKTNAYLFQTKNPARVIDFELPELSVVCVTLESDIHYPILMGYTPSPLERASAMSAINYPKFVTIEPILDFDLDAFITIIKMCKPEQVNIGADSGNNDLPEPSREKVIKLISALEEFTKVKQKKNLSRIMK